MAQIAVIRGLDDIHRREFIRVQLILQLALDRRIRPFDNRIAGSEIEQLDRVSRRHAG